MVIEILIRIIIQVEILSSKDVSFVLELTMRFFIKNQEVTSSTLSLGRI